MRLTGIRTTLSFGILFIFLMITSHAAYTFINTYGAASMNGNQYIQVDKGGMVWVCSYDQNSIRVFHPNGNEAPFSPITSGKNSSGTVIKMYQPSGIAMDSAGIIYVTCDFGGNKNILKYQSWDGIALNGFEPSFRPGDIDIDNNNNVFIVEKVSSNEHVQFYVMNTAGTVLTGSPVTVAASTAGTYINRGIGVTRDGTRVYIASDSDSCVFKFTGSVSGGIAGYTQTADLASGLGAPGACEVDSYGNIYVSTTTDRSVRIYNSSGTLTETLSGSGLIAPRGVGFYPNSQVLFIAQFASFTSLQRWVIPPNVQIPVLGYHNVTASWNDASHQHTSTDNFKDMLNFIQRHNYTVISIDSLYAHWMNGAPLPTNPICITFDDNYEGETKYGVSELTTRGWPSMVFAHTFYVGYSNGLGIRATWDTLSAFELSGLFKAESHTVTHYNLTGYPEVTVFSEYTASKAAIESHLMRPCKYMAYPNGADTFSTSTSYPRCALPTVAGYAGFQLTFSYAGGLASRTTAQQAIPRVTMAGTDMLNTFKTKIGYSGGRILNDPYIIDNSGGDGTFTLTGSWSSGAILTNSHVGCYGSDFRYISAGTGSNTAVYRPTIENEAFYDVYVWYDADTNRGTNVPVTVSSMSGSTTYQVNETTGGFCWYYLGRHRFAAGSAGTITITDNANGVVTADAVKLEYYSATVPVELSSFSQD